MVVSRMSQSIYGVSLSVSGVTWSVSGVARSVSGVARSVSGVAQSVSGLSFGCLWLSLVVFVVPWGDPKIILRQYQPGLIRIQLSLKHPWVTEIIFTRS